MRHLNAYHKIIDSSGDDTTDSSRTQDIAPTRPFFPVTTARKLALEELVVGFVVDSSQPFNVFSNPFLQQILQQMAPDAHGVTSWGRTAVKNRLTKTYMAKREEIRADLLSAKSLIHLTFDLWTSPNGLAILAVSGHYIDREYIPQQRLLALREQLGAHSGKNIAATVVKVLAEWGITDRIGAIVADNASNNDTCCEELYKQLPIYTQLRPEMGLQDIRHRRLRCFGHILNLVARAFLFGEDEEALEQESQSMDVTTDRADSALVNMRRSGPVAKLHRLVKWVRSSPQRSQFFRHCTNESDGNDEEPLLAGETAKELQLIQNNETRWNSTYMMIMRAIRLRDRIEIFFESITESQLPFPSEDHLSADDWLLLREIAAILQPIHEFTLRTQSLAKSGNHGSLWEVITGMEFVLEKLEDWKLFFADEWEQTARERTPPTAHPRKRQRVSKLRSTRSSIYSADEALAATTAQARARSETTEALSEDSRSYLRLSVTNGWTILNKYYTKLEDSPLYAAAVFLHPRFGERFLTGQWQEDHMDWLVQAKVDFEKYWRRHYLDPDSEQNPSPPPSRPAPEGDSFDQWTASRVPLQGPVVSELERFQMIPREELEKCRNPITWWAARQEAFPTLSKFALDVFAIPAMAADCERAFSLSKLTLTSQRLAMDADTLDYTQCLKNWIIRGAITLGGVSAQSTASRAPEPTSTSIVGSLFDH